MGPSGSGKSTLLHCAAGLDKVTSGRVLLAGQDITTAPDNVLTLMRRRVIGFVFQSFNLNGSLTAEQNVAFPLKMAGVRVSKGEVRQALADVGLGDRAQATGTVRRSAARSIAVSRSMPSFSSSSGVTTWFSPRPHADETQAGVVQTPEHPPW
ncbi:ATP-binding cassette domain-containing protein [Amycolatopsis sp. cmx-11-51]|uniref:ATP-binding cassette domain-containing protein n=1 Tax=unclassified Amycolatopsis TaxID=2618356 RepID=UPI0039E49B1C